MEPANHLNPALRFLDEFANIQQSRNRLPHWQQDRVTCFLTFRLADSIPAVLLAKWREDRDLWCLAYPQPWSTETEAEYHKRFSSVIDRHLDEGHGSCLLRELANAAIVARAFADFDHSRYLLHAWAIMPNHVHMLLSPCAEFPLSRIVAGWKRFTATKIHARTQDSGSLWQKDYFDRLIRDWDHFMNVARYIRRNPAKAKLPDGEFLLYESPWVQRLLA